LETRRIWVASLILLGTMTGAATAGESQLFELTIREYNLAGVAKQELAEAHQQAQRILKEVGITIRWEEGEPSNPEAYVTDLSSPPSSRMNLPAPDRVVMRIVLNKGDRFSGGEMGKSLPFAARGVQVTIVSDNIERVCYKTEIPVETLLAYVMVHEIGHVLLRSSGHSFGIMRANWTRWDYDQIRFGTLGFIATDKAALREAIQDRLGQDAIQPNIRAETSTRAVLTNSRIESQPFELTIREYNLAGIKDRELVQTHREVERIFQKVGIAIRWERGRSAEPEAHQVNLSTRDWSAAKLPIPDRINVLILSNKQIGFAVHSLGNAFPFARSVQARVFSDNVCQTAFEFQVRPELLLGYVIAHELGHVLLRSERHSFGIMRASWVVWDYEQMRRGALNFTVADKAVLRQAIEDRLTQNAIQPGRQAETNARSDLASIKIK
jgi:hypothetical protein